MRNRLVLLSILALGSVAPGCGNDTAGDDTPDPLVLDGGRIALPGCDYDLVNRVGAEAPALGEDVLGAEPDPLQVRLGFGGDPRTSMAVIWKTDEDTLATTVKYGVGTDLDETAAGMTYRFVAGIGGIGDSIRLHEAHLCGLVADTQYSYQVGGVGADGAESWSDVHSFRTAPDVGADPAAEIAVGFTGDTRDGYAAWADVADQLMARSPDVLVYTGDIVSLGPLQEEWDAFFDAAPELFASIPLVSAHGNHEINSISYYAQMAMPGDEEDFSFDYGHLHVVVMNTDPLNVGDLTGDLPVFLDDDLTAATAPWSIVSFHRSIYSSGANHGSDVTLKEAWGPVIDEHLVDVVVSGHDHIFERTKPMRGDVVGATPADGTIYMVSGGAGANLYSTTFGTPDQAVFTEYAESTYNATVIRIRSTMLTSTSFRSDGSLLDEYVITKP